MHIDGEFVLLQVCRKVIDGSLHADEFNLVRVWLRCLWGNAGTVSPALGLGLDGWICEYGLHS